MKERILKCKECGATTFTIVETIDPVDKLGRCMTIYECKKGHITKSVQWGRMSIWYILQRISKLEKKTL